MPFHKGRGVSEEHKIHPNKHCVINHHLPACFHPSRLLYGVCSVEVLHFL